MTDRPQFEVINDEDGKLDEVIMQHCDFHLERMDDECFWIGIDNQTIGLYHIQVFVENGKLGARIYKA